ncbi:MAG: ribonuclease H-like domain-containing protein [Gemmatimonadota bacterium]|nr:ribonuclease H-like domain-containing protein [Gemmatimonadota bacterium]MDH3291598.1 ribonuclease H-like domain-containing protein [Gemmatimonadota bacterium]MDH3366501.1 ribonuclease H-like domain-containing protein [Gemmatimonadota bacterium]MDH3478890.1 ribonuclease H-like domain-containing protein [Gemmatimonadota bacterium]MDH3571204.1 ribonuclease H-like domain-containing protein [Gemmatimonadota bacterium]
MAPPRGAPFALDIETVPQRRWRDPYKMDSDDIETDAPEGEAGEPVAIEQGKYPLKITGTIPACHPITGQVVSVSMGWLDDTKGIQTKTVQVSTIADPNPWDEFTELEQRDLEREILRESWRLVARALETRKVLVTFNGKGFDLPMMRWRSALLGIQLPTFKWYELLYPYRHQEHIDLRLLFSDGDRRARGTLSVWSEAFGIEAREAGHHVLGWALAGQWDELARYGTQEMQTLIDLYDRVRLAI